MESVAITDPGPEDHPPECTHPRAPLYSGKKLRKIAIALSIYAGFRIFVFAAAFPFFNNIDEKLHFLTVRMYAQGHLPGKELPLIDRDFARESLPYWSPEFDRSSGFIIRNGITTPLYRLAPQARELALSQKYYAWKLEDLPRRPNFEAQAPPLYYLLAGGWYRIGAAMGLSDWRLLYWTRFLNGILYGLFVWVSYRFVCQVYPEHRFLCVAVPALLAVFPQDVFFGMNRDVLSPLMCAAALLFMAKVLAGQRNQDRLLVIAFLFVGLSFLVELSNCVLYGALAATMWLWASHSPKMLQDKMRVISAAILAATLPPSLWMLRNYLVLGNLTGSGAKLRYFGWTFKPFPDLLHHPLFTIHGLAYFLANLTRTFWQGEYTWHELPMTSRFADRFYVLSTAVLIAIFIIDLVRRRGTLSELHNWTGWQSLYLLGSSVLFMAATSVIFDYHNYGFPSRLSPFFISGRIISGALLPFAVVCSGALESLASRSRRAFVPIAVLACLLLFISISDIRTRAAAFSSPYNFFALSSWPQP